MHDSQRLSDAPPPILQQIADLIRANPGTISLAMANVHWGPPKEVLDAVARFGRDNKDHQYASAAGLTPLIDAIEQKLWNENKIKIAPASRLVVTGGANMAFTNALLAITDPGDEIILNAPYYGNHRTAITLASCKPVIVPTDDTYQPQLDLIRDAITDKTRAIVTSSPNNPTGVVYHAETLYDINQLCR